MHTFWFCAVAAMIAAYVILDGFDLGAGIIHLWVARTEEERRRVLESIGPFWDGNEVWLLAAGGTLFFAFPALYSASFSGFYLPLTIVLWLLMLRGIAIEFRAHVEGPLWRPLWDVVFCGASALLAIFLGAALGNVVRGVPLGETGFFFLPLWGDFGVNGELGILDWYTVVVGVAGFATLMLHGALWVAFRTDGELAARCRELAARVWWVVALLAVVITGLSFFIQPQLWVGFSARPWGIVFPAAGVVALALVRAWMARGTSAAFLASCGFIAAMLASAAFGLYPYVLVARGEARWGLTISNAAAAGYGLQAGMWWFVPGMVLVVGYFVFTYWRFGSQMDTDGRR
ncbi:MAG: cytochrome d ubiquinol oxidase subunit II [Acidobacteriota bacterium]|nr:cytochrome d ubiquinol oxidase subunit II [Acidobacteriota bacterium]